MPAIAAPSPTSAVHTVQRWFLPVLLGLFFCSGMCGLIYQVLWLRLLSLVFGVTVWAASTVLASFMAGLGLGSLLAGRMADRVRLPLLWYGGIEILVGLAALATPLALRMVERVYVAASPAFGDSLAALTIVRFALSSAVLLVPTTLMGATLPIVVKSSLSRQAEVGRHVSLLYAANTAGAVVGVLLAGFVLIGGVGVSAAFRIAATLNVAIGLLAALAALPSLQTRSTGGSRRQVEPRAAPLRQETLPRRARMVVLAVFAVSGFTSLALEVIWFRTLVLYLVATSYAFTIMLATVLAGIAAGSFVVAPMLRRRLGTLTTLAIIELGIAAAAAGSLRLLARATDLFADASALLPFLPSYIAVAVIASVVALFPVSLLMGMAFPIGLELWAGGGAANDRAGERIGLFYALNVFGAILGSAAAGFVLLPTLGSRGSLVFVSGITLLSALVLLACTPGRSRRFATAIGGVALFAGLVATMPDPFQTAVARRYGGEELLWQEEGIQTTVTVHRRKDQALALYLDGLYQASDLPGQLRIHRVNGHLPMVLHPNPQRTLVVGMGGGVTAGAVGLHPASVDLVELSSSVVHGSEWFRHVNDIPLERPNVRLRVDDGRNFLLIGNRQYDVITSDVVGPTHAGAGTLYSAEYFQLAREALADDGIMAQWVGPFPESQHKLILRTFLSVFPETTAWFDGTVLIGSKQPLRLKRSDFEAHVADPVLRERLESLGIGDFDALLGQYWAGPDELRQYVGDGPILTDDRPMVEYFLSLPVGEPAADMSHVRRGDVRRILVE